MPRYGYVCPRFHDFDLVFRMGEAKPIEVPCREPGCDLRARRYYTAPMQQVDNIDRWQQGDYLKATGQVFHNKQDRDNWIVANQAEPMSQERYRNHYVRPWEEQREEYMSVVGSGRSWEDHQRTKAEAHHNSVEEKARRAGVSVNLYDASEERQHDYHAEDYADETFVGRQIGEAEVRTADGKAEKVPAYERLEPALEPV